MTLYDARFLDYAAQRIFRRKVGGGYIFVHRLLQGYFASFETKGTASIPQDAGQIDLAPHRDRL